MVEAYDKLVRDRIPALVEADGDRAETHRAGDAEYARRLGEKLVEEAEEYRESGDREELADVLEVVAAIRAFEGIEDGELEAIRAEKADERGGFGERVVLERVVPGEGGGEES